MRTKLKFFGYSLCLTGLLFLASNVYSQPSDVSKEKGKEERMTNRISEAGKELKLTPAQEKQLDANRKQHKEQNKKLIADVKKKRNDLKEELQKPELDMKKINQTHAELKGLIGQLEDDRLNGILGVRKILTPEQFSKFTQIMNKRGSGEGKKRKGGRDEGTPRINKKKSSDKTELKEDN